MQGQIDVVVGVEVPVVAFDTVALPSTMAFAAFEVVVVAELEAGDEVEADFVDMKPLEFVYMVSLPKVIVPVELLPFEEGKVLEGKVLPPFGKTYQVVAFVEMGSRFHK